MPEYDVRNRTSTQYHIHKIVFGRSGECFVFNSKEYYEFSLENPQFDNSTQISSEDIGYMIEALEKLKAIMKEHNAI